MGYTKTVKGPRKNKGTYKGSRPAKTQPNETPRN